MTKKHYGQAVLGKEKRKSYFDVPVSTIEKPGPGNYRV